MYAAVLETTGHNRRRSAAVLGRNARSVFATQSGSARPEHH